MASYCVSFILFIIANIIVANKQINIAVITIIHRIFFSISVNKANSYGPFIIVFLNYATANPTKRANEQPEYNPDIPIYANPFLDKVIVVNASGSEVHIPKIVIPIKDSSNLKITT